MCTAHYGEEILFFFLWGGGVWDVIENFNFTSLFEMNKNKQAAAIFSEFCRKRITFAHITFANRFLDAHRGHP